MKPVVSGIDVVILFEVTDDVVLKRIEGRSCKYPDDDIVFCAFVSLNFKDIHSIF